MREDEEGLNFYLCCAASLLILVLLILALALPRKLYDDFLLGHITEFMERTGSKLLPKIPVGAEAAMGKTSIWGADTRTSYLPLRMYIGGRFMTGFIFESRPVKEDYEVETKDEHRYDEKESPLADLIGTLLGVVVLWILYHTILRPRRYHVCYVPAGIDNGSMMVKPEGVMDKIKSGIGYKDVSVGERDFDSKFLITAPNAAFPKSFFTPEMRRFFKKRVDFNLLIQDGDLVIWKQAISNVPGLWLCLLGRNKEYLNWLLKVKPVVAKMLEIYEARYAPTEDATTVEEAG